MCQTKYLSNISSPSINSNFVSAIVKRSDDVIKEFRIKMLTQDCAEKVRKLLLNLESFRTCGCSEEEICKIHNRD